MKMTGGQRAAFHRRQGFGGQARRLRGILKRQPGEKPLSETMAGHKRREKKLEEAKYSRSTGSG